jgi:hypothetical protein
VMGEGRGPLCEDLDPGHGCAAWSSQQWCLHLSPMGLVAGGGSKGGA